MISIVIPTYQPKLIEKTLDSIPLKFRSDTNVVENGSSIAQSVKDFGVNYLYLKESGANKARNYGWKNCQSEYILFTDDDIEFSEDYFSYLTTILSDYKPNMIGGKVELKDPEPWIQESFASTLAEVQWEKDLGYGSNIMFLHRPEHYLVGANMCIKRSFLEKHHGFDENFGYNKDRIPNDELYLLDKAGSFLYSPLLKVIHHIEGRCTLEYMKRRFEGQAIADCRYYAQFEPNRQSLIKGHIITMVESLVTHKEINKARNKIKNEEMTEKFIEYLVECRTIYLNAFMKELDNVY